MPLDERSTLTAAIDLLVAELVARAAGGGWAVRADHCFRRIAYDNAVGARWDRVYRRPAWRRLPTGRLAAAVAILEASVAGGPGVLAGFNAKSLDWRQEAGGRAAGAQGRLALGT